MWTMGQRPLTAAPPLNATATPFAPASLVPQSENTPSAGSDDADTSIDHNPNDKVKLEKKSAYVEEEDDEDDDGEEAIITLVSLASPTKRDVFPAQISRAASPAVHPNLPSPPDSDSAEVVSRDTSGDKIIVSSPSKGVSDISKNETSTESVGSPPATSTPKPDSSMHNTNNGADTSDRSIQLPMPAHFSASDLTSSETQTPNVYINGLPPHFPEDQLFALAAPFGAVHSVRTFTRHVGDKSSGYGFVLFEAVDSAARCIESLRKYRNLHPSFSKQVHKIPGTVYANVQTSATNAATFPDKNEIEGNSFKSRMERLKDTQSTNLYIEGLPLSIDETMLAQLVAPHPIRSSRFFQTKLSHPPRIIAFVRLETRQAAEEVIENLHGRLVRGWNDSGSRIAVRFADTPGQRSLRRAERRGCEFDEEEEDSASSRITIAQAALLNLRGHDIAPSPPHPLIGTRRDGTPSMNNGTHARMNPAHSVNSAIHLGDLEGVRPEPTSTYAANGYTQAEELLLKEHARVALGARRGLGVLGRRTAGIAPPRAHQQGFVPHYSDIYSQESNHNAFRVNAARGPSGNSPMDRLQRARGELKLPNQHLNHHLLDLRQVPTANVVDQRHQQLPYQRERELTRSNRLLSQERTAAGQFYEQIRSPAEQRQQQALLDELRELRLQEEELEARKRELATEEERERQEGEHAAHIRTTTLPQRAQRNGGSKHFTHNSMGGLPVARTANGVPVTLSAPSHPKNQQQKQYQHHPSVAVYEPPAARSPTITYNPTHMLSKQNYGTVGQMQKPMVATSVIGDVKSPPLAAPGLSHSPRTPASLSPVTPFLGGFGQGVFGSNR